MGKGWNVCYKRVSTWEQSTARQLEGVDIAFDRIFEDKVSGKDLKRPAFQEMLSTLRQGDTVYVHSLDRLCRNLEDLLATVKTFDAKGVSLRFVKENLTFEPGNEASPMTTLTLHILGAFAHFERSIIKERQREGIEIARTKGVYKGGNNRVKPEVAERILERLAAGAKVTEVANEFGVSRQTIYTLKGERKS